MHAVMLPWCLPAIVALYPPRHERYTWLMYLKHAIQRLALTAVAGLFALPAVAQWQWIDKDGRKVYSDQSPPADIRDKDILKRPAGRSAPAAQTPATTETATPANAPAVRGSAAAAPKLSGKDKELEERKKQTEAEEALKKKAGDDKQAKARADTCERAKRALNTLQSGVRIAMTNTAGEREVMDDTKRAEETKRTKEVADSSCK